MARARSGTQQFDVVQFPPHHTAVRITGADRPGVEPKNSFKAGGSVPNSSRAGTSTGAP